MRTLGAIVLSLMGSACINPRITPVELVPAVEESRLFLSDDVRPFIELLNNTYEFMHMGANGEYRPNRIAITERNRDSPSELPGTVVHEDLHDLWKFFLDKEDRKAVQNWSLSKRFYAESISAISGLLHGSNSYPPKILNSLLPADTIDILTSHKGMLKNVTHNLMLDDELDKNGWDLFTAYPSMDGRQDFLSSYNTLVQSAIVNQIFVGSIPDYNLLGPEEKLEYAVNARKVILHIGKAVNMRDELRDNAGFPDGYESFFTSLLTKTWRRYVEDSYQGDSPKYQIRFFGNEVFAHIGEEAFSSKDPNAIPKDLEHVYRKVIDYRYFTSTRSQLLQRKLVLR